MEALQNNVIRAISTFGGKIVGTVEDFGGFMRYLQKALRESVRRPFRTRIILQQMEFIGNQSFSIIVFSAFFVGAVFSLQIGILFKVFRAEGIMGAVTGKALARELAPLLTGFLLAGRAGSAMTAEISTMKVNEQVDAMEAMAVEPIHYLVVPRLIAILLMAPLLSGLFVFVGEVGAFVVAVTMFDVDQGAFFTKIGSIVNMDDFWSGLQKAVAFGAMVAVISCRYGLVASGGAKGVGKATTNSVVMTLLVILLLDFVITYIQVNM